MAHRLVIVAMALLLGAGLLAQFLDAAFYVTLASRVAILALAGVGLNFALGLGGMVSFGHAAFLGGGGYVAGILAYHASVGEPLTDWPFVISSSNDLVVLLLAAFAVIALMALAIGALSLRTSGVYFIMITLAFAQMIYYFAISFPSYGGEDGLTIDERATLPGTELTGLDLSGDFSFFGLSMLLLALALTLTTIMARARFGTMIQAIAANEARVEAIGVESYGYKLAAFVISAVIAAAAGVLIVELDGFVSPALLSWHMSGEIMVIVILGGVGRMAGPVFGAAMLVTLESLLGDITEHWQLFLGLLLLFVVLFARGGLVGLLERIGLLRPGLLPRSSSAQKAQNMPAGRAND